MHKRVARRRSARRRSDASDHDDWNAPLVCDDGLPDWSEKNAVAAMEEEFALASRTRRNIMDTRAADECKLYQLGGLRPSVRAAVVSKLRRLASAGSGFAEAAMETPARTYVLLYKGKERLDDVLQLSPGELRKTQLSVAGGRGPSAGAGNALPLPERLLGFCVVKRLRSKRLTGHIINSVEFFDTLCHGYNLGQLLWQRMGERCCNPNSPGDPTSALALWPLPHAPNNILYWTRIEQRMPQLGPGGMLLIYGQLSVQRPRLITGLGLEGPQAAATAAAAAADAADTNQQQQHHHLLHKQQQQRQQQHLLRASCDPGAWRDLCRPFADFCTEDLGWDEAAVDAYLARTRAALVDMGQPQPQQQQVEESQKLQHQQQQQQEQERQVEKRTEAPGALRGPATCGTCEAVADGAGGGSTAPGGWNGGGMGRQGRTAAGAVGGCCGGGMGGRVGMGGSMGRSGAPHALPWDGGVGYRGVMRVVGQQGRVGCWRQGAWGAVRARGVAGRALSGSRRLAVGCTP